MMVVDMRRFLSALLLPFSFAATVTSQAPTKRPVAQPVLGHRSAPLLTGDGLQFKDLNRNGKLDRYEDWRLSPAERAADLAGKMSVEDLAGVMVHGTLPAVGGAEAS